MLNQGLQIDKVMPHRWGGYSIDRKSKIGLTFLI